MNADRIAPNQALNGMIYAAANSVCIRTVPTDAGIKMLQGWEPPYSATVIERLEAAGARYAGRPGSADGNRANFTVAPDIQGSLRRMATETGQIGFKPAYGRISRYGIITETASLDTPGILGHSATVIAAVLREIAGPDVRDNTSVVLPIPDYAVETDKGIRGLRIGYWDSGCVACEQMESFVKAQGAEWVGALSIPGSEYAEAAAFVIAQVEAFSNLQRFSGLTFGVPTEQPTADMYDLYDKSRGDGFDRETKLRLLAGLWLSRKEPYERYVLRGMKARGMIRQAMDALFAEQADLLLTPVTDTSLRLPSLTGHPAAVFSGIQAIAPDFREDLLLRWVRACERTEAGRDA